MSTFNLAGHSIEFSHYHEVGQGGPDTCAMSIDGQAITRRFLWGRPRTLRFHPTPLEFGGDVLIPLWQATRFYLVRINTRTLRFKRLSKGFGYMRLLRVEGTEVEFSTWWDTSVVYWDEVTPMTCHNPNDLSQTHACGSSQGGQNAGSSFGPQGTNPSANGPGPNDGNGGNGGRPQNNDELRGQLLEAVRRGREEEARRERRPPYNPTVNYCGADGGRRFPSGNWNQACFAHDQCYANASGSIGGKLACDARFAGDIVAACSEGIPMPVVCAAPAAAYSGAVGLFAWPAYNRGR